MAVTVFLARHGQTIWHADNRYAGSSDIALTDAGRAQAAALGRWAAAAGLTGLVASPLRRAQDTAAPASAVTGLDVTTEPDLREQHFGAAEGRTLAEVQRVSPVEVAAFVADPWANALPGAETAQQVADRFGAAVRALGDGRSGNRVLAVCHNTAIRIGLCGLLGLTGANYRALLAAPANTSVTELLVPEVAEPGADSGPVQLVRYNQSPASAGT